MFALHAQDGEQDIIQSFQQELRKLVCVYGESNNLTQTPVLASNVERDNGSY